MTLVQQLGAAIILLLITLSLQCGGAAALIIWIRSIPKETKKVRVFRCAALVKNGIAVSQLIVEGGQRHFLRNAFFFKDHTAKSAVSCLVVLQM